MKITLGIDIGGSTTKIVGFHHDSKELIQPLFVKTEEPITSLYGAFGKFLSLNQLELKDIDHILMTGVGSSFLEKGIYNIPCVKVDEFESIGRGGLYLSGLSDIMVVSMGTGTAIVHAKKGAPSEYLGGTGVGGGTLAGLSKLLLQVETIRSIQDLADKGDLSKIDLRIGDMLKEGTLVSDMTASNFGNVSDLATKEDTALGILNMIFETIGMMAIFAARSHKVKDIVLTGNLSRLRYAKDVFAKMSTMFDVHFIIPENAEFATVIGAALGEASV